MRVAGSVIWATDLSESAATTGAKGQPDTVYSYSVSIAIAVSSRPIVGIGRIWADGKLIRGADGIFKISTGFRFHAGSEAQEIDPFIASVEGIANTPAYRGLALAVFENLELAEFGNRIPFLTFEILGSEEPPTLAHIADDASDGVVRCNSDQQVHGFAAYGRSVRSALTPLVDAFGLALFDDGEVFQSPVDAAPIVLADEDLGSGIDDAPAPKTQREQVAAATLPSTVRLSFYNPLREFQAAEVRAVADDQPGAEEEVELPAALDPGVAGRLNQSTLARRWAERDTLTLRLPPRFAGLKPGARLQIGPADKYWTAFRCTVEGFALVAELRPTAPLSSGPLPAQLTKVSIQPAAIPNPDSELILALFDTPAAADWNSTQPTLLLAASSEQPGWRPPLVDMQCGSHAFVVKGAARKTVIGRVRSVLRPGEPGLIDARAALDVVLIDREQWLTGCDDFALFGGVNLALIGQELVQFGTVDPIGPGRFRLSRLLRGLRGTEWAAATHREGEYFALIEAETLRPVCLPEWAIGARVIARGRGLGHQPAETIMRAQALHPLAPVKLTVNVLEDGGLDLHWVRRSRGGAWIDEVDAPLVESREKYRVRISGAKGSIELACKAPALRVSAPELAQVGQGQATLQVQQVGDRAVSRPVQRPITLP